MCELCSIWYVCSRDKVENDKNVQTGGYKDVIIQRKYIFANAKREYQRINEGRFHLLFCEKIIIKMFININKWNNLGNLGR